MESKLWWCESSQGPLEKSFNCLMECWLKDLQQKQRGIILPEKSQGKVLQAIVVAVEAGSKGKSGEIQPLSVKLEDKVLPEYGGTKVILENKDHFLFRDGDILGKYVE